MTVGAPIEIYDAREIRVALLKELEPYTAFQISTDEPDFMIYMKLPDVLPDPGRAYPIQCVRMFRALNDPDTALVNMELDKRVIPMVASLAFRKELVMQKHRMGARIDV